MAGKRTAKKTMDESGVLLKTWVDSYAEVSKIWEDTYLKLQKPWVETASELVDKAAEVTKEASPEKFEEFYMEWVKAYQANFGGVFPVQAVEYNKETLEKLMAGAEEFRKLNESWTEDLDENARKTRQVLRGEPDPEKYKEAYDAWMKTFDKVFDELMDLSTIEAIKEVLEKYAGVPDVYLSSFIQLSKVWRQSYAKLYQPWIDGMAQLSQKTAEMSRGAVTPKDYEEFYALWMKTYQETYGKAVESVRPTREMLDTFVQSTDVYLNMYKSWIAALEKMAEKTRQLTEQASDPEISQEFYGLWIKMYEKAFSSFFEDMPMTGPMKDMMAPVKIMADINAEAFSRMSTFWARGFDARKRAA
jgi:hypothetical protein